MTEYLWEGPVFQGITTWTLWHRPEGLESHRRLQILCTFNALYLCKGERTLPFLESRIKSGRLTALRWAEAFMNELDFLLNPLPSRPAWRRTALLGEAVSNAFTDQIVANAVWGQHTLVDAQFPNLKGNGGEVGCMGRKNSRVCLQFNTFNFIFSAKAFLCPYLHNNDRMLQPEVWPVCCRHALFTIFEILLLHRLRAVLNIISPL